VLSRERNKKLIQIRDQRWFIVENQVEAVTPVVREKLEYVKIFLLLFPQCLRGIYVPARHGMCAKHPSHKGNIDRHVV
jgi:hypothetical protein